MAETTPAHDAEARVTEVDREGFEILDRDECLRLLGTVSLGRVGVTVGALPLVLPVAFRVVGSDIVFCAGIGTTLDSATRDSVVAFEADDFDSGTQTGWSVVVTGVATSDVDVDDVPAETIEWLAHGRGRGPTVRHRLAKLSTPIIAGRRSSQPRC